LYHGVVRLSLVLAATAACGCGRWKFDDQPDAASDARAADAAPFPTCDWSAGPPFTGLALRRTELSSLVNEVDPFIAPGDPLTIYFGSLRSGSIDIFTATRPAVDQAFGTVTPVMDLNTGIGNETGLILDRTSTIGFFTSSQKIHGVVRDVLGGPLRDTGVVSELEVDPVFQDAWPSPDGLAMTYSAILAPAQIYTASRADRGDPWSGVTRSPVNVTGVSSGGATLTADQRVMVWSSEVGGEVDIYYSVRASATDPFPPRRRLDAASLPGLLDFEPGIREDGCELFFSREITASDQDIFSLVATP
jgi:hypothetical protein